MYNFHMNIQFILCEFIQNMVITKLTALLFYTNFHSELQILNAEAQKKYYSF